MLNALAIIVSVMSLATPALQEGADVDVTGKWNLTTTTPRGDRTQEAEFVQEGEELTVISEDRDGNWVESKGTVKGNEITWSLDRETPRGKLTLTYTGKVEGDTMQGAVQFGDFGSGEWKAERIPEAEAEGEKEQ